MEVKGYCKIGYDFSLKHLISAAHFCQLCRQYEKENIDSSPKGPSDIQISYVTASVMLSVAALEGYANSLLSKPKDLFPDINKDSAEILCDLLEKKSILEKYNSILSFRTKDTMCHDKIYNHVYNHAETLIYFRNYLIHPRILWGISEPSLNKSIKKKEKKEDITNRLKSIKFALNPLISPNDTNSIYRYFSYGCANWAFETSKHFMSQFCVRACLPDRFNNIASKLEIR